MITVMVGPDLNALLLAAIRGSVPSLLIGGTGVGKSQAVAQAANDLRISLIIRDLSIMEAPDLAGLPVCEDGRLVYRAPKFLPSEGRGILMFEELNRAPRHVRAPCYQLLTARTLNDYRLPDGWLPMAAINPSDDPAYDVEELDDALTARFLKIRVEPCVDAWITWAERNGIHNGVMRFVREIPNVFAIPGSNPRAWAMVSSFLHANEHACNAKVMLTGVAGLVGEELARALLRTLQKGDSGRIPTPTELAYQYGVIQDRVLDWKRKGDSAALASVAHQGELFLQNPAGEDVARTHREVFNNLSVLASDLPADLGRSLQRRLKKIERHAKHE